MLQKTRSASMTSTRATVRTTTSSEVSFGSSTNGSRLGVSAYQSDASTALSTYSVEDLNNSLSPMCITSCPPMPNASSGDTYDDVAVIDELYAFFAAQVDMGKTDLSGLDIVSSNRERVLKELYDTEGRYIAKLQAVIEYYKKPMMVTLRQSSNTGQTNSASLPRNFLSSNKSAGVIRGNDAELVFGNIDDLLMVSRQLYNGLKNRFRIWGPIQLVSDVIEPLVLDAPSYISYYENYGQAMSILERLSRTPATRKYVESMMDAGQISLFSLLNLPLLSIPRYAHLLKELVLYTDPDHPDAKKLEQCSWRMSRLEKSIQPLLQKCQTVGRLVDIICLVRNCPMLLDEPRHFVMRGQLTSLSPGSYSGKDERRMYFLLSDMLIFVRPQSDNGSSPLYFKGKIDLRDAVIRELPKKKINHLYAFEITINSSDPDYKYADDIDALLAAAGGSTAETYYLKTDSKEAMSMWMTELQNVINRLKPPLRRP